MRFFLVVEVSPVYVTKITKYLVFFGSVVIKKVISGNCPQVCAALAARIFFLIPPIEFLNSGVVVAVIDTKAPKGIGHCRVPLVLYHGEATREISVMVISSAFKKNEN